MYNCAEIVNATHAPMDISWDIGKKIGDINISFK